MKRTFQKDGLVGWIGFAGSVILAAFLTWFGIQILGTDTILSNTTLFWLGCAAGFGGVFLLGTQVKNGGKLSVGGILLLISLFFFARAGGVIHGAWLTKLSGIACFLAACLLVYVMLPRSGSADELPSEDL